MKDDRAKEIAKELTKHSKWRSHSRSIKIKDLESIGLRITKVDEDDKLKDIVYRIQAVSRLLFGTTNTYKIFATEKEKIFKSAVSAQDVLRIPKSVQLPEVAELDQKCPQCGKGYKIYAKLVNNPAIDQDFHKRGYIPFPKDNKIKCDCGFELDLGGIRNEIEMKSGMKVLD